MQEFCDTCCREIPTDAPGGLCPVCLLKAGLSDRQAEATAKTTPHSVARQVVVPNPEELQPHFPEHEILSLIGQGGMGAVYQALQTKLDRPVALKIILPETAADPSFAERFAREAKTLAKLNHPSIVGIHDFGEIEDGYYFVMEYVAGVNLRQILSDGKLQQSQALSIVHQICNALQYAHDQGVIHRDIKPENILVDQDGQVKIADFGLARLNPNATGEDAERYFTLTGTHQVMGTPRYMAPEQIEASSRVDHRADIYSLGVVFYEMLTGQVPMGSFEPPSQKEAVDNRLDNVVLKAMAREPDRRYQQISSLAVDINSIAGVDSSQAFHSTSNATIYATNDQGAQGFGTIFDRDARAVGPWVANAFTGTEGPTNRRAPVFVMIALCLIGILAGIFPWAEVTAVPMGYSKMPGTAVVASAGDAAVATSPVDSLADSIADSVADSIADAIAETNGKKGSKTVLAEMQYKNVLNGYSHPLGVLAMIEFAVMALILIATPIKRQLSSGLATTLMVMSIFAIIGLSVYMATAPDDSDFLYSTPLPDHVEGPLRFASMSPQLGYIVSFASAVGMLLLSAVGLRHATAAEEELAASTPSVVDIPDEPFVGGSDTVTISRFDIDEGKLPAICMHCGSPSVDVHNHTFTWQPKFFEELARHGMHRVNKAVGSFAARKFRLPIPVCQKHRRSFGKFFLWCSTGWLLPLFVGGIGAIPIIHFADQGDDIPIIAVSVIIGFMFLCALAVWIVQMVRLYQRLPKATRIENDAITLDQVSWKFVRAFQKNDVG